MNRKKLMMILATTTIIATMIFPMLLSQTAIAAQVPYDPDNMTVPGVLHSDDYVLWPWEDKSLTIGFSKYGEMIDRDTKVGLEYAGVVDPFATDPATVVEYEWVEGWILDITYEIGGMYKNVWAFALHSDYYNMSSIDGPWREGVTVAPTNVTVLGGRKTSGGAITQPITVLYDGPRRFVALLYTVIYEDAGHNYPLVGLTITVVFNKVKKQVILYKDIKRLDTRKSVGDMQIEFSERGQWDLGAGAPPKAYAHIFEYQSTVYDYEYQGWYNNAPSGFDGTYDVCQILDDAVNPISGLPEPDYIAWAAWWPKPITSYVEAIHLVNRQTILNTMSTHEEIWEGNASISAYVIDDYVPVPHPTDNTTGNWIENPMVFVNNEFRIEGSHYDYNTATNTITFYPAWVPIDGAEVKAVYKHDASRTDMSVEPGVPFTNAEWCFTMDEATDMFRAVTVYGVGEWTDGRDAAMGVSNNLDCQIEYYLEETFNPYDLYDAVHKQTRRWVEFYTVTSTDYFNAAFGIDLYIGLDQDPVLEAYPWERYASFSERVLWGGDLKYPLRSPFWSMPFNPYDYELITYSDGSGVIRIPYTMVPAVGTKIKILYSTRPQWYRSTSVTLPSASINTANVTTPITVTFEDLWRDYVLPEDPLGVVHGWNFTVDLDVTLENLQDFTDTVIVILDGVHYDYKVIYDPNSVTESTMEHWYFYWDDIIDDAGTNFDVRMPTRNPTNLIWNTTVNEESTDIDTLDIWQWFYVDATYNTTFNWFNITVTPVMVINYQEHQMGEYEWMIVGKDAATIDSAGAAYMTQAFDSKKQIHVRWTGLDIKDPVYGTYAPYVMAGATTGLRTDYYYDYAAGDDRCGLHDDWCTTVPVSSSNMLFSGGPRANLGAEYFNEFTMGFYARNEHATTNIGQADTLLALSCWDKHTFGSGYAVVSVYVDLNGTVGFLIWGVDGQDTYYATKWFWDIGIYQLQVMNRGVTDYIIEIEYLSIFHLPTHPWIYQVERLGTISEKEQHDCPVDPIPIGP